ncbi:MAG: queG [Bacteroidetes bacterium]|nr:queG [Bacteroidota bacterium]
MITGSMNYDSRVAAALIKERAREIGFSACGIAQVHTLPDDSESLARWLQAGHHGKMGYLANHADLRNDPSLLVPGAKSVVVVLLNYATDHRQQAGQTRLARYAQGITDYHFTIRQFLGELLRFINDEIAPVEGRAFCDSAPVFERRWAYEAGLGWIGRNHCLIHPELGSFCFIGELIVDLELVCDKPLGGDCGYCGRCVEACPTQALPTDGFLKAEKCVSYLTVELKDEIPAEYSTRLNGFVAGCDRCQEVCPWNRKASHSTSPLWHVNEEILHLSDQGWMTLKKADFRKKFSKTALSRLGYEKLIQNCRYVVSDNDVESGRGDGKN